MSSAGARAAQETAKKWYQNKRVPLYVVVGGTISSAAYFLLGNRAMHPQVQTHKGTRQDGAPESMPSSPMAAYAEDASHGASSQGSGMRKGLRDSALMNKGQTTDGILPNDKIVGAMRSVVGHEHPENEEVMKNKK